MQIMSPVKQTTLKELYLKKKKKQVTGRFFSAGDQVHYLALYYIPIDN